MSVNRNIYFNLVERLQRYKLVIDQLALRLLIELVIIFLHQRYNNYNAVRLNEKFNTQ